MCPQIDCMTRCKVFSTVCFQMWAWIRTGKVTLVAYVFLHCRSSNVSSSHLAVKMHSHIGCICLILWHCQFVSAFWHLHLLNQYHKFSFVWLPLRVVLCQNGWFKLIQIYNLACKVLHGILSLFSYTITNTNNDNLLLFTRQTSELVPKDGKSIADCRGALESVILAMYGSKHVKISFHN